MTGRGYYDLIRRMRSGLLQANPGSRPVGGRWAGGGQRRRGGEEEEDEEDDDDGGRGVAKKGKAKG